MSTTAPISTSSLSAGTGIPVSWMCVLNGAAGAAVYQVLAYSPPFVHPPISTSPWHIPLNCTAQFRRDQTRPQGQTRDTCGNQWRLCELCGHVQSNSHVWIAMCESACQQRLTAVQVGSRWNQRVYRNESTAKYRVLFDTRGLIVSNELAAARRPIIAVMIKSMKEL